MTQLSLFDSPISRTTDPLTSHVAVADVAPKLCGYRREFVERLRALGEGTAQEIAAGNESIRKRAAECERLGYIEAVGVRECTRTKKMANVYRVRNF